MTAPGGGIETARGHYKIFLGIAAGVGKTYRMLQEARARAESGEGRGDMTEAIVAGVFALLALSALGAPISRATDKLPHRITPPAERILFPLLGDTVSCSALDATLRLARAEGATLVSAYLITVPLHLPINAPLPIQCERAMPLLETIEQRAARLGVPVDSRIQTGRSTRHALRQLLEQERFDRTVVTAATGTSSGFSAEDVAWLLENAPGEVVVVRAEPEA